MCSTPSPFCWPTTAAVFSSTAATVLCISIVCSTMLLKQHSCIDVILGIVLALALDSLFNMAFARSDLPQVRRV